jgi:NAD(P)-dependent dehydrogenase (short-subunit alcohol dehydrogenase family)
MKSTSSLRSDRLTGKVALVTGGGAGIGRGCALMFARHGAQVMSTDLNPQGAQETVALATQEGLSIESTHPIDITVPADVERLVARTVERFGRLDVLGQRGGMGCVRVDRSHGL